MTTVTMPHAMPSIVSPARNRCSRIAAAAWRTTSFSSMSASDSDSSATPDADYISYRSASIGGSDAARRAG